jgi:hypothetical protein
MKKPIHLALAFFLLPLIVLGDSFLYSGSVDIKVEGNQVVARHYHGEGAVDPFSLEQGSGLNGRLTVIKKSGETLIDQPVGPFQRILLDEENEVVALLSSIKQSHGYQLLVVDFEGNVRLALDFASIALMIRDRERLQLEDEFPAMKEFLARYGYPSRSGFTYVGSLNLSYLRRLELSGKSFDELIDKIEPYLVPEGLDREFCSESITVKFYWFRDQEPAGQFTEEKEELYLEVFIFDDSATDKPTPIPTHRFRIPKKGSALHLDVLGIRDMLEGTTSRHMTIDFAALIYA